jgi:hypothetical protein
MLTGRGAVLGRKASRRRGVGRVPRGLGAFFIDSSNSFHTDSYVVRE